MRETDVGLGLLLSWLAERHGRSFAIESVEELATGALAATARDDGRRLAVEVHPLIPPAADDVWLAEREQMEEEMGRGLDGAYALWLPPGADLPRDTSEGDDLVRRFQETARQLEPGERAHLPLPVSIYIRKQQDEGSIFTVVGGLNQYWARLSERARGSFDLDSRRLHRLPEDNEHLERLFQAIWEKASALRAGQAAEVETVDAWTVQRLREGAGVAIVGRPPRELADVGLAVRKNFRRTLSEAGPQLRGVDADVRALAVLGFYGRMEEEGATTAMRGYDPTLYAGLDFVCLAADGLVKALMEARSGALP